jgi:regulation of enolase protein 1 (concanavalin A-like superfamily)
MSQINFLSEDIGNIDLKGSIEKIGTGYDVIAGGKDIWDNTDQFHFVYVIIDDDFDMAVRLESLSMADLYTKAGLMARKSLLTDSEHVFFMVFPDNSPRNKNNGGYEFQYREKLGADSFAIYPNDYSSERAEFPINYPNTWLRLKRSGDLFYGFYSTDGETWKLYCSYEMKIDRTVYLGLAVTSHNENETVKASFRDITIK